jgi:hypothetical protein
MRFRLRVDSQYEKRRMGHVDFMDVVESLFTGVLMLTSEPL